MSSALIANDAIRGDRTDIELAAFVAPLAIELGRQGTPSWTNVDGSLLMADISGFTALSERLANKGKAGAEEITSLLNACFATLIDAAASFGGEVIKFGGDALLVLFRGDRNERRAVDASCAMQQAMLASSEARHASLTMTIGVASGPFDVFIVGDEYRELLIIGERASDVIRLENAARAGETMVDSVIAAMRPPAMRLRADAGGFVVVGQTGDEPFESRTPNVAATNDECRPYVPSAVVDQLQAVSGLGGEHRLVTRRVRLDHRTRRGDRQHGPRGDGSRACRHHRPSA
jgi:class 3 adenylate cyclase